MRIFLIIAVLFLLLGSVELFAQYRYDYEFDVVCSSRFQLRVEYKYWNDNDWRLAHEPSGTYGGSQLITWNQPMEPSVTGIKVRAWTDYAVFEEIRNPTLHGVNYFYIELYHEPEPPGPPVPKGGDE